MVISAERVDKSNDVDVVFNRYVQATLQDDNSDESSSIVITTIVVAVVIGVATIVFSGILLRNEHPRVLHNSFTNLRDPFVLISFSYSVHMKGFVFQRYL